MYVIETVLYILYMNFSVMPEWFKCLTNMQVVIGAKPGRVKILFASLRVFFI